MFKSVGRLERILKEGEVSSLEVCLESCMRFSEFIGYLPSSFSEMCSRASPPENVVESIMSFGVFYELITILFLEREPCTILHLLAPSCTIWHHSAP